ncbi:MAG TPA: hypothetical protein PLB21_15300 [Actinomycetota bacterium]|nr:hypothetical protein [Actinomycetota bacterium]
MTSPTPLRDRVAWLHRDIANRVREASSLELEVALLTAVAGIATGLAQTNVHAADAVLSQVADVLGVSE